MAPPAWLPPLNSHNHSLIDVLISEDPNPSCLRTNDGNEIQCNFFIRLHVCINFYSKDDVHMKVEFPGLSVGVIEPVDVKNHELLASSIRDMILNEYIIPFKLDDFFYREHHLNRRSSSWSYFSHRSQLIRKLRNFVHVVDQKPKNAGRKLVCVNVDINSSVAIPNEDFNSWANWYEEQKKVYPDFEEEYKKAISVPRHPDAVLDEALSLMWRRSARRAIVRELETVVMNDNDDQGGDSSEKSCAICLEEFRRGARATRLSCHHLFHEKCIIRWLRENHACPLCRHRLPLD